MNERWRVEIDSRESFHRRPSKFVLEVNDTEVWWIYNKTISSARDCGIVV